MTALAARYRGAIAAIRRGIVGTLSGPTTITTSMAATATAYSNQRKIDRCQNGVLWTVHLPSGSSTAEWQFYYSADDGATWVNSGTHIAPLNTLSDRTVNGSLFIDLDDYAHFVYKELSDGYIYYRRGTPNAGRTAWTWSAATLIDNSAEANDYPDVVAHRQDTGWRAHVVWSWQTSTVNYTKYKTVSITSGAVISVGSEVLLGGSYSASVHTYPSIDFNHTGDGKTVAGGTPHLYAAWSAGTTGAGYGIRFKKATYSGGSWTWGTEREIDNTRYVDSSASFWLNCLFDGTRAVIAGQVRKTNTCLVLYQRDAADTTTTTTVFVDDSTSATTNIDAGSATYDGDGNVYFVGRVYDTAWRVGYQKWTRAIATLESKTVLDSTSGANPYVSAKRGYSNSRIEFIYTDGASSPYDVRYGGIS